MPAWRLHWLEAEGNLDRWRPDIAAQIEAARATLAAHIAPPRLDVLVARRAGGTVIAELGLGATAYLPTLFQLACDPSNAAFETSLADGAAARLALHEAHHCLRMAGPGYGETLGEALVSEGLAGRFVQHLLDTPPEPWERALSPGGLSPHRPDQEALAAAYDRGRWFYGSADKPRWLGYALGFEIVGRWAERAQPATPAGWIDTPATEILEAAGFDLT